MNQVNSPNKSPNNAHNFVHLRTHSAYSLLEGALPVEKIIQLAAQDGAPAVAITDSGNLFGALEFSEKCVKASVQPITAVTLAVKLDDGVYAPSLAGSQRNKEIPTIALFAQNEVGYKNLMALVSQSFLDTPDNETPHIPLAILQKYTAGLIALSGGPAGPINKALFEENKDRAQHVFEILSSIFPNRFYIELQRHNLPEEITVETALIKLAYDNDIPLVATNECFFIKPQDYKAHDALICISQSTVVGADDRLRLSPEHYFKSGQEMVKLFDDLPEAIENTQLIARRCHFRPHTREPILPNFTGSSGKDAQKAEAEALTKDARKGLKKRLEFHGPAEGFTEKDYYNRLDFELKIINDMQFPGYFLIVSDFIKWSKDNHIPVGPGRGSGAGSLVAYSLTITGLDPLMWGLLFERFLNPERVSMPDFDIDFCQDRREEVINYVQKKYGFDQVAQIITFGKLQARAVLRDVGRVLQMPYGQVDRLCKLVPNAPGSAMTLAQAIAAEPKLRQERDAEEIVAQLLEIGQNLEGLYRHASTHAAGVVIGDRPLSQLVPLYRDPRSEMPVTQFNMKWVEPAGLVKFDFLGLKTLTVLKKTVELLKQRGVEVDLESLPIDNKASYELMTRGQTIGVFQLESSGMRDMLRGLKPDRFEDIIAIVALYRPGPMDNIPAYIARKHGQQKPDFLHPKLEEVLKETHGVIIYQEQVMKIAQLLSGYSLGEADLLRRAMGKKDQAEMDRQRQIFNDGAVANGVDANKADYIFDLVNKFAGYGFNKSHAAAYALVAYQTAYLKANHPVEFMAALMTLDMGNIDKLQIFQQECKQMGIDVLPPDINKSGVEFVVEGNKIRYSLAALKNVGSQAVEAIVAGRKKVSKFKDIAHFAENLNTRHVNKRAVENMIKTGAFDALNPDRAQLFKGLDSIMAFANKSQSDKEIGMIDMFAAMGDEAVSGEKLPLAKTKAWSNIEILEHEKKAAGFYISGHPLDDYSTLLKQMKIIDWEQFTKNILAGGKKSAKLAATITAKQEKRSKKGNKFAFIGLSDASGQYEAVMFGDILEKYEQYMTVGTLIIAHIGADIDGDQIRPRINSVEPLEKQATKSLQTSVKIYLEGKQTVDFIKEQLELGGKGEVSLVVNSEDKQFEVEILLKGQYIMSSERIAALKSLPQVQSIIQN
ncbi:MAG: DNA polymerase III subunit alpha [Rhizobiales bacterium]|nr:DNA polymerase III subunit alpha [Hyphomicrobiales bacterium]NRB12840.1 DNA polymerase III subunit alpha [Hyphomicrobiales bacterium]